MKTRIRLALTIETSDHPIETQERVFAVTEMLWNLVQGTPNFKDQHVVAVRHGEVLIERGDSPKERV